VITNLLILISRMANVVIGGGESHTMLCAWAWENQCCDGRAAWVVWFIDNWTPLRWWVTPGVAWTHCQECWLKERQRKQVIWQIVESERKANGLL
jgi:hypothetical protein